MIFVEDINFNSWSKGMFCKQSLDMGIGQFFTILEYVCSQTDTYFAKVDKDYTSQICPNCGTHTGKKELDVRVHKCLECGYEQDRDVAASLIIKQRGLEQTAVQLGLGGNPQGDYFSSLVKSLYGNPSSFSEGSSTTKMSKEVPNCNGV